jgi:beta-lactam-binding protein with PASTA domain
MWWRKPLRGLGFLAYGGLVALAFLLAGYLSFNFFVRSGVTAVPDLRGLSEEGAQALLTDQGLEARRRDDETRYDEEIPAGHVVAQQPGSRSLVKRGSVVRLILSQGPNQVRVPDVTGRAPQAAQVTLAAAGLTAGETLAIFSNAQAPGLVALQAPSPGGVAAPATAVRLYAVAERPGDTYVMPDLVYRRFEEVRDFFASQGFRLGSVKLEPYEGVGEGVVLRQFPLAGHPVERQDAIALVVAAAPELPEPSLPAPEI